MTKIPEPENSTRAAIDRHHESRKESPRMHLGCSLLGHHCDRWLWLSFRWAVNEPFPGRILRLFRRGQNEEAVVVSDLRAIGCEVDAEEDGKQYRVNFGKHVSGSMDGIVRSGLPEAPNKEHVLEIKTHSAKSFKDLSAKNVKDSKPQHWAQMQVYMHGTGIDRALYVAVCKDDDSLHIERVKYDKDAAVRFVQRGHRIAMSDRMPEPCPGASPEWYLCKFCAGYDMCHKGHPTKEINCRTCAHYTATDDSQNHCARWQSFIPKEAMIAGCRSHVFHPDMVPWQMLDGDEHNAIYDIDGAAVRNGEEGMASAEILDNIVTIKKHKPFTKKLGAEVVDVTPLPKKSD